MKVYLTTPHEVNAGDELPQCGDLVCRFSGHHLPHVCFSTQPTPGKGEWVYIVDLPAADAEAYEYKNIFRQDQALYFALPHKQISALPREKVGYEKLTGQPWRDIGEIQVWKRNEHRRDRAEDAWALLWTSRVGVASARIAEKSKRGGAEHLTIQVELEDSFDPEKDYILSEEHTFVQTGYGYKDKWQLVLKAGRMPEWAAFPWAWARWAFDPRVEKSAIDYLLSVAPHLSNDIRAAQQAEAKTNKTRLWRIVGERLNEVVGRSLGEFDAKSWTQVQAMPLRMAMRIGGWEPPIPKPEFYHPDQSGRILLASPEGAFPKKQYSYEEGTTPRGMEETPFHEKKEDQDFKQGVPCPR
jgi:hypothetical protein